MKKASIFIVLVLLFAGCTYKCPGFPKDLAEFFPYERYDSLHFVNKQNDTLTFSVYGINIPQEHTYKKGWCSKCENCMPYICAIELNSELCEMFFEINIKSIPPNYEQNVYTFYNHPCHYPYSTYNQKHIYGTMNNDSIFFSADSDSTYIDSLVVVKGKGLTSFNTFDGHKYSLVDE